MAWSELALREMASLAVQGYFDAWGRRMHPGAIDAAVAAALPVADQGKDAICDAMERAMAPYKIRKVREQDRPSNRVAAHG